MKNLKIGDVVTLRSEEGIQGGVVSSVSQNGFFQTKISSGETEYILTVEMIELVNGRCAKFRTFPRSISYESNEKGE